MVKEVRALYDQYKNNEIGLKEYTDSVQEVVNKEEYLNISRTGMTPIAQYLNDETNRMTDANNKLNESYDRMSERANGLTLDIQTLRQAVKGTGEDDDGEVGLVIPSDEELAETLGRYAEHFEKPTEEVNKFSDALEGVDIGLRELPESTANSLKGAAKFAAGMKAITKDLFAQDSAIRDQVIGSMGAIAMASAGSKAEQLKVQKFMVKANVAKGIIDIFTNPAPKGPLEIAKAVALSASLVARGVNQTKTIDEQIANINASKSSAKTQTRFAQYGMNEVVDSATPIVAGEAGAELVQITPLEGANLDGPQGGGNIVITGNVLSRDFVQGELIDEIREAIRQGYDFR
jgi:hypothetical protein